MQMGIIYTRLLGVPMISENLSVFPGASEQAIAVFLCSSFELTF